jgi:TM2 domain-containing membrane protein YozV
MEKDYLQSKLKSTGKAYVYFFFFGAHYVYLGKIIIQLLFWMTLGGFGIWLLFDLFTLSAKVKVYNDRILKKIEEIQQKDRFVQEPRNVELLKSLNLDRKPIGKQGESIG